MNLNERDEELGRWRWPANPDYVVYPPVGGEPAVRVLDEVQVTVDLVFRDGLDGRGALVAQAARAYFNAHPKRPWGDACPGEVWVVTELADPERAYLVDDFQFYDSSRDYALNFDDSNIVAARRIWPESD